MRSAATQEPQDLLEDARRGRTSQVATVAYHPVVHLWVEPHVETCAELDGTKNPYRIFAEANVRIADGAQKVFFQVCDAADEVDDFTALEIVEQAVDREVTTNRILVRLTEHVVVRDQQVRIVAFRDGAVRGDQSNRLRPSTQWNLVG